MRSRHSRRTFIKGAGMFAASAAFLPVRGILGADAAQDKLRVAVIGCGGQGVGTHIPGALQQKLVACVDPSPKSIANAMKKAQSVDKANFNPENVKTFSDYRELFDKMKNEIDAVSIATPNHHHALPALIAMSLGKHVYVEKPMAHDIKESRLMAEYAKKYKVMTQMGNQGHSQDGWRRFCEYIWAGAIGDVHTIYCWTNRANGGSGPRPPAMPVPEGMNWDSWIGPAPYRDYHKDLHPHEWHNWHDFGNGSIGNMACHVMDGAHWAFKLGIPTCVEVEQVVGGGDELYPLSTRIRWDYPAREGMGPVKVYWYDGMKPGTKNVGTGDYIGSVSDTARNRPAEVDEWEKKLGRNFGGDGSMYIGTKGVMVAGCYGGGPRIIPEESHKAFAAPKESLPRIRGGGGHHGDFFRAIRDGKPAASDFAVAHKLMDMILLGWMAVRAGVGKKLEWDGDKVANLPEANRFISRDYRKGWEIPA